MYQTRRGQGQRPGRNCWCAGLVTILALLSLCGAVVARTTASPQELGPTLLASGGGRAVAGDAELLAAVGQPLVGGAGAADVDVDAGFWPAVVGGVGGPGEVIFADGFESGALTPWQVSP